MITAGALPADGEYGYNGGIDSKRDGERGLQCASMKSESLD